MRAYYVKKLLQKSLRVLENRPKEVKAKISLREMALQRHDRLVQLMAFNRFKMHWKKNRGHAKSKLLAAAFFRNRIGHVYLR